MVSKYLFYLGAMLRNPNLKKFYKELKNTDKVEYKKLKKIQESKFKSLVEFTFQYSPYYRHKYEESGLKREDINSLDDLEKLPIIEKSELKENAEKIKSIFKFKNLFTSETSGTSGQPLKFYKSEEWDSMARASMYRGYSWYGIKPWEKNGYLWGYNIAPSIRKKIAILDKLQNRFRIFSYSEKEIIRFAKKLKHAKYLEGYSSMIFEVAKQINIINSIEKPKSLKLIKGTAEKIFDNYHEETLKAFGLKIISEYGAAETGIIAFECPKGYMHINSENVIVEIIEDEIIVTNLMSSSFPIIRYRLGDKVILAPKDFKCDCGREHPIILDILGRVGKNLKGYINQYPSLTFYYVFKNLTLNSNLVLNYQAVQNEVGKVLLKIEQNRPEVENLIRKELEKYFKKDIDFEISFGVKLHKMDGKLRDFISTIT